MYISDPIKIEKAKKIHEQARYFRGRFLNYVAVIEHDLAEIITLYFAKSNNEIQELFFINIASNMSLEKKRIILIKILKNFDSKYYEDNKNAIEDIQEIQVFRNKLAHSMVDISDEALQRPYELGIGFIQWKNGEPISEEMFENWENRTTMVLAVLNEVKIKLQTNISTKA